MASQDERDNMIINSPRHTNERIKNLIKNSTLAHGNTQNIRNDKQKVLKQLFIIVDSVQQSENSCLCRCPVPVQSADGRGRKPGDQQGSHRVTTSHLTFIFML